MKNKKNDYVISILFLLPAILLVLLFVAYPIVYNFLLSFNTWKGISGTNWKFVGLQNYVKILRNNSFWKSMLNSIYFMIGGFFILMPISFGLAMFITSKLKFTRILKTAYFMPVMLGITAVALMWVNILNPTYGAISQFLGFIGKDNMIMDWLATPTINVWVVVLVNEWIFAGYNMLIFAAGLVSIPGSILEAATVDGCSGFKKLIYIILPLSKNSFKIFSVLCITGCLKTFDIVWAMTNGGPNNVSATPGVLLYTEAFSHRLYGRSGAIGVILILLGIFSSLALNKAFKQDDIYA